MELEGDLADEFAAKPGEPPLMKDPANGGYVFAPSLNQATSAAILRAGYLSNASRQARVRLPSIFPPLACESHSR